MGRQKVLNKMLKCELIEMVNSLDHEIDQLSLDRYKAQRECNETQALLMKSEDSLEESRCRYRKVKQSICTMIAVKHPKRLPQVHVGVIPNPGDNEDFEFLSYLLKLLR